MQNIIKGNFLKKILLNILLATFIFIGLFFPVAPKTEAVFLSVPNSSYLTDGQVNVVLPDGSGGVYVGGSIFDDRRFSS